MPTTICPAIKESGAMCPIRRSCGNYTALIDLAIAHTNISIALKSKAVTEIKPVFKVKAENTTCLNFKEI